MSPVPLVVVAGARPNFMKVAPLLHALAGDPDFATILVHTGQHYDQNMSGQFFSDLGIPSPQYHLEAGSGTHAQQTAEIMKRLEPVLIQEQAAGIVVVGDVNSTTAGALVAAKLGMAVVHIEAGLRSFDRTMPEEINRMVTDAISDLFLVTEESGRTNLLREGKSADRIRMVGNLMIDSLRKNQERALKSDVRQRIGAPERFGLVTLHRPANVDDPAQLAEILGALTEISDELPLYWAVHPRTRARIEAAGKSYAMGRIHMLEPLGYLDFLCMQANSAVVLTDSGGIQEETTVLGVPCLTLRDNTERPVTVDSGTNRLAGTRRETILSAWRDSREHPKEGRIPPLWDGNAGLRCRLALREFFLDAAPGSAA
ncbi:MAG TPA: UDP-N-acetylglucosamine 2-epimerase (non-hydrolyzing) [Bryobacteraceae bacterium]|nr:UDP-N-acetylglucosamine 2-epimerase (non-hydrolyzing) [Bryobacteraceae bacterium]